MGSTESVESSNSGIRTQAGRGADNRALNLPRLDFNEDSVRIINFLKGLLVNKFYCD